MADSKLLRLGLIDNESDFVKLGDDGDVVEGAGFDIDVNVACFSDVVVLFWAKAFAVVGLGLKLKWAAG